MRHFIITAAALAVAALAVLGAATAPAIAQDKRVDTEAGPVTVKTLASGLVHPWGMAFLPDGRLLVTERAGRLRIMDRDGSLSEPVANTPKVFATGQGGLLDVALDPDFASNQMIYLSFAEPGEGGASTAVGRGRLDGTTLRDFTVLFREQPKVEGGNHFGGRIVFAPDGKLFLTLGERFTFQPAQDLTNHLGTVIRINRDGSVPQDNPFVGKQDARPEIWSYGHRNIEAGGIDPQTGKLWIGEMGPRGGDELNQPQPGRNYGWPVVSWGKHYSGKPIPDPPTHPEFADAVTHWTPVISPSGLLFYTGSLFPQWRGSLFLGSLTRQSLVRLTLDNGKVTHQEIIAMGARIRDVEQGPDGAVYLLTDQQDGKVWRLQPAH